MSCRIDGRGQERLPLPPDEVKPLHKLKSLPIGHL